MNRRNLVKALAFLPFWGRLGWAEGTNPDPKKNIKFPSGAWLNVGEKWEVKNIEPTNFYAYYDKEFNTFVVFEEYNEKRLKETIHQMESRDGFFGGVVYSNGTNRFGLLACCYI